MSSNNSFSHIFVKAPVGRFFLNKVFKRVAYDNIKLKDDIDMEVQETLVSLIFIGTALVIPQHSKNSPNGLLKSLLVGTSGMLHKSFLLGILT
jgi:hypothetical protein